MHVKKGKDVRS